MTTLGEKQGFLAIFTFSQPNYCLLFQQAFFGLKTAIFEENTRKMAVTVGFEPTVGFHPHNFSRVAPSATRTRHRIKGYFIYINVHI
jgi:hypothetical protein